MGAKNTVLAAGQPPTVAFTVLAQLCGPQANETEMGAALFTKNEDGRTLTFFISGTNKDFSILQRGQAFNA